ncbi:hypothetical protein MHYP_G00149980 [Metynnis hypsauchen]
MFRHKDTEKDQCKGFPELPQSFAALQMPIPALKNRGEMFMVVSSKTEPESRVVGSAADGDMWVCIQWEKLT